MATNKLIVIEGLDGSGKATQARRLTKALVDREIPVREVSFPDYDSDSSALVRMYLSGQFGTDPQDVNAYAASSFFAVVLCCFSIALQTERTGSIKVNNACGIVV